MIPIRKRPMISPDNFHFKRLMENAAMEPKRMDAITEAPDTSTEFVKYLPILPAIYAFR